MYLSALYSALYYLLRHAASWLKLITVITGEGLESSDKGDNPLCKQFLKHMKTICQTRFLSERFLVLIICWDSTEKITISNNQV